MAGLIPQAFIDDLLDRVDIVDIVDARVKLKKNGKNYSACCPFHDEKTPSFTVSPDKQFYYCFGCGASGNAVGFLIDYDRLSFPEAVEQAAKTCGLDVPRESREISPKQRERKNIYALLEKADDYYRRQLRTHRLRDEAIKYLKGRGLSGEIARDFAIGYAPPGWDNLLQHLGQETEDRQLLIEGGMLINREQDQKLYDRFRHRIMFPIRDTRGRVIGFGGRVLGDDKPKYLNSPETPVFHKGRELYGLFEARRAYRQLPRLLVVEGYMDVVALAQFEIRYAVATLGTACGEEHLTRAFRYTSEVVFCFDGDNAGRSAARRALENTLPAMEDGRRVKFLFLPEGEDPDTLVRQIGPEKFSRMIDNAVPLEEFLFDAVVEDIDIRSMEGRARLSKLAAPLLDRLPKGVYRELMFNSLATRTGLNVDTLLELIKELPPRNPPSQQVLSQQKSPEHTGQPPGAGDKPRQGTDDDDSAPAYDYPQDYPPSNHWDSDVPEPVRDSGGAHAPPIRRAASRQASAHQIKLPPQKLIASLLLQHPELAGEVQQTEALRTLNDIDLNVFLDLVELLRQRPNYSISRILGYWRATYGAQATDQLAQLAASQLLVSAKQLGPYDPGAEFRDTLNKIHSRLTALNRRQLLDKFKSSAFNELSAEDKQMLKEALASRTKDP